MKKESFKGILNSVLAAKELSAILPLIVLVVIAFFINPNFLSRGNIFDILRSASFNIILAIPITFLMSSGQMDLSIGAVTALGGVVAAIAQTKGVPLAIAVLLGLGSGAAIGLINGVLVERFRMPAFILTMATQYAVNGLILVITGNNAVTGLSNSFRAIAQTRVWNINLTVFYSLIFAAVGHVIYNCAKYGREVLAIGGNPETAHLAGIKLKARRIQLFVATGFCAALTGILYASRFSSAQTNAGSGTELTIMASVIIGGTSLYGGSGSIIGAVLGCVLFAAISNALPVMGVSNSWQKVVFGIILVIALFIDRMRIKKTSSK